MSTDLAAPTRLLPTILLATDPDDPRLVTDDGEVVPLATAEVPQLAAFLDTLRQMREAVGAAEQAARSELAARSDAAGTRTLRAGSAKVTLDAPTETVFGLDAALVELRDLVAERLYHRDDLAAAVEQIARVKVTREPDMAAIKRLRAMGAPDVIAILDQHPTVRPRARRSVKVEWEVAS